MTCDSCVKLQGELQWGRIEGAKIQREAELLKDAILLNQLALEEVMQHIQGRV